MDLSHHLQFHGFIFQLNLWIWIVYNLDIALCTQPLLATPILKERW